MENVLYFLDSPVNIISVTAFATQLGDDEGTFITTKRNYSIFEWDNSQYRKFIYHPTSHNLPQMVVNEGYEYFCNFGIFLNKIFSIPFALGTLQKSNKDESPLDAIGIKDPTGLIPSVAATTIHLANDSYCKHKDTYFNCLVTGKMNVSTKEEANNVYQIGENYYYCKDDDQGISTLIDITQESDDSPVYFHLKLHATDQIVSVTSDYVFDSDHKDIAEILDKDKYTKISLCLTEEEIEYLRNPLPATYLEREYLREHEKYNHILPTNFFRLCKRGDLSKKI